MLKEKRTSIRSANRHIHRWALLLLGTLLGVVFLSACSKPAPSATGSTSGTAGAASGSSTAGSAQPQKPIALKLGWVKATANLAAYLAPDSGQKFQLEVQSQNFNTAVDITTALVSGQIDVGLLTPAHLIQSIDARTNLVQIAGNVRGNTAVVISKNLALKENDWDGLKALLKQKKIRVASSRGSINEALAIAEFRAHGINIEKETEFVNVANFAQHVQALRLGEFQMIITLEPHATIAVKEGVGTLFTHPYTSPAGDLNTVYVVRKDWLEKNRDAAQRFVNTIAAAQTTLSADKKAELDAASSLTGIDRAILEDALKNNRYNTDNGVAQMKEFAKIQAERGIISRDVSGELAQWVDESFVKNAAK